MPGADQRAPVIGPAEADQLLAPLAGHRHLVLAVSGGSDSVALMVLAARWAKARADAPRFSVLTVDHRLRPDAGNEAVKVGQWANALNLEHRKLDWQGRGPASGLQAAARQARYGLMSQWCTEHGAEAIITGHTANDQAETVLMRLARGSGLDGLAGMAPEKSSPWPVLRPLLGVTRDRLRATLIATGHGWIDDPSNDDDQFERIRVRKALATLGLDAEAIALSAKRLGRARHALDLGARALVGSALVCHDTGFGELDLAAFASAPEELRVRVLQTLVWQFGSREMPKLAALERVAGWILDGDGRARTISGCRIVRRRRLLVLGREPARVNQAPMPLDLDGGATQATWDARFRLFIGNARSGDRLSVAPFGAVIASKPGNFSADDSHMPAFVRDSLPVILNHGSLDCVPHLGISGVNENSKLSVDVSFMTI